MAASLLEREELEDQSRRERIEEERLAERTWLVEERRWEVARLDALFASNSKELAEREAILEGLQNQILEAKAKAERELQDRRKDHQGDQALLDSVESEQGSLEDQIREFKTSFDGASSIAEKLNRGREN